MIKVMSLSILLRVGRGFASDLDRFNSIFGSKDVFKNAAGDFPKLSADFADLTSLEKLTIDQRVAAIDKASASIRSKLDNSQKWPFEVGETFADMLTPFFLQIKPGGGDIDFTKLDEAAIRSSLNKLNDLGRTAPPDFPKNVLAKLKTFAGLGQMKDLFSDANQIVFSDKIVDLFEAISPENEN